MIYYLDTEFNEFGGALLSLALVREDGRSLYIVYDPPEKIGPWVAENVMPIMSSVPRGVDLCRVEDLRKGAHFISSFLQGDHEPTIVADWPDDVRYFCQALMIGPGLMLGPSRMCFDMHRVDAYPTTLPGAIQHNAWWDAMALRHYHQARRS